MHVYRKTMGMRIRKANSITNQLQMLRYNAKEKGFEVIGEIWTMVILEPPSTGRI